MTIRIRLLAIVLGVMLVVLGLITAIFGIYSYRTGERIATELAISKSSEVSKELEVVFEDGMLTARYLAMTLEGMKTVSTLDRSTINGVLRKLLVENDNFEGVWTCWEPNAFDGFDWYYKDTPGHDETGRFVPYWHRVGNEIVVAPLIDYDIEGPGDYYQLSLQTGKETVIEPYDYLIGDEFITITSLVAPIYHNNRVVGVAGVDFTMEQIWSISSAVKLYESGFGMVVTNHGLIISESFGERESISSEKLKILASENALTNIKEGSEYTEYVQDEDDEQNLFMSYAPINIGNTETPWSFVTIVKTDEILKEVNQLISVLVLISTVGVIVMGITVSYNTEKVVQPLRMTLDLAEEISKGNLKVKFPNDVLDKNNEISRMAVVFNQMIDNLELSFDKINRANEALQINEIQLRIRTTELAKSNKELETHKINLEKVVETRTRKLQISLAELKETQSRLIESEKLASLGVLVAGVAHEMNTPIGVCVTSSSYLTNKVEKIIEKIDTGDLKKNELIDFINITNDCSATIDLNLERVSSLIKKFKLISMEQTLEEKTHFSLVNKIEEALAGLRMDLGEIIHEITIFSEEDIEVYSSSDAWNKVIKNLVHNALAHAFLDGEKGHVSIRIVNLTDRIRLSVSDNGVGIYKENLDRIFDPFFTTKRGSGRAGLGLNIVYNTVRQSLNGTIYLNDNYHDGTEFIVEVPFAEVTLDIHDATIL